MSLRKMSTLLLMAALVVAALVGCEDNIGAKAHLPPNIGAVTLIPAPVANVATPTPTPTTVADTDPGTLAPGVVSPVACPFNGQVTRGCDPAQVRSICNDGTGSCSTGSGTCSGHGGVCVTL